MRKTVLDLNCNQANKFFLDPKSYSRLELPPYYSFGGLLSLISKRLNGRSIVQTELLSAKKTEDVNHIIYSNKDGKYAWRKLELINPYLYISLVNLITDHTAWDIICERFKLLRNNKSIMCMSIPVLPDSNQTQQATQISEWINLIERESIKLALDYEYLFETDISDCYRSLYTHSVSWALHDKSISKENRDYDDLLGNKVDWHLQAMSYGETNGIPQGSILMDFIAEIILVYADRELFRKLSENPEIKKNEYRILRYRDDYRIFVRKPNQGELILKTLSENLAELGMHLNTIKTRKSEEVIIDSVKPDKIASFHDPKLEKINQYTVRNELLMIYEQGLKYPNCGSIKRRLDNIDKVTTNQLFQEHHEEIISILANIVFDNPSSIHIASALISKAIKNLGKKEKKAILKKLFRKFGLLPNSGHLEIWLQRLTIAHKIINNYKEKLCTKASGEEIEIFNTSWISSPKIREIIKETKIIDQKIIENLDVIITRKEVELFTSLTY